MNIKLELLKEHIFDIISQNLDNLNINLDEIADTKAINALSEIQEILSSDEDDFMVVERIVCVFEKYHLSFGSRHDF